jgi:ADP-heptose:LPS heptosyltransferase
MNLAFQRRVDRFVGVPLCRLLSILPGARYRATDAPPPRRILVILLSEMGSLVLAQPMFGRIARKYPEASVYALVFRKNKEVLDLLEVIPETNVLTLRNDSLVHVLTDALSAIRALRRLGIDTVLDCELFSRVSAILSYLSGASLRVGFERHNQEGLYRGSFINRPVLYNPYQHISRQFLTLVEAAGSSGRPLAKLLPEEEKIVIPPLRLRAGEVEEMRSRIESDFPAIRGAPLALVYPGGGLLPIRAWPIASFQALASSLADRGFTVGIIGLGEDQSLAQAIRDAAPAGKTIDFTGYTKTVRELMLLFHIAQLLVTNDGGPGHFAAMTPIRTIVLYGPETPVLYGSLDPKSVSFFRNLSCSPCLTAYNHRNSPCDGDNQCLKAIRPEDVLERALERS